MPGRTHVAGPGEPRCPEPGCERPAGLFTEHRGEGPCLRHAPHSTAQPSHRAPIEPIPEPSPEPPRAESAPEPDPLARRLTGSRAQPCPDPLAILRLVLASAQRAGYPFGEAWTIGAEAALSYMSRSRAEQWWEALSATERAWAAAYQREGSLLASFQKHYMRD